MKNNNKETYVKTGKYVYKRNPKTGEIDTSRRYPVYKKVSK